MAEFRHTPRCGRGRKSYSEHMNFLVRSIAAAFWAIGIGNPAVSKPPPSTQALYPVVEQCKDTATQAETLSCLVAATARSHAALQRIYERDLRKALDLDSKFSAFAKDHHAVGSSLADHLRASQKAWLRYSQAQCALEGGSSFGGSGTDILEANCHYRHNSQRIAELNAAYVLLNR